ncbi:hypothetical protein OSK54_12015 [Escherichia coli]|uniref:glycine-rich domain-containing protein n=1 Tax=Escherichia coli TaxID=562 RepID=UPI0020222414|nr:hypothetical protein [Escherichia coli]MDA6411030.1 hypothetical protein [Escherichia coli]
MNRSDSPKKQPKPFGVNGQRGAILPTTPAGDNSASYEQGFPPITMILKSAGGLPPKGQDMNQILYELSALGRWSSTGALNTFDSEFASEISGYPSGAMLISDDGERIFINTTEGNLSDPNSNGTGWKDILSYLGLIDANGYSGRKIGEQWITTSSTYVPTAGTKRIKVTITGGGGGGGGAFNSGSASDNFSGAGGAAGATGIKWFNIADITNFAVVIGAGGTEATKGGDSTFSGIVATGGAPSVASTVFASGGTGVAGTGADVNISGGDGGDGQNGTRLLNGIGGASFWGGGRRSGQGSVTTPTIPKATVYGGGGGGAYDTQTLSTRFYGGSGANGICLIEEFA